MWLAILEFTYVGVMHLQTSVTLGVYPLHAWVYIPCMAVYPLRGCISPAWVYIPCMGVYYIFA